MKINYKSFFSLDTNCERDFPNKTSAVARDDVFWGLNVFCSVLNQLLCYKAYSSCQNILQQIFWVWGFCSLYLIERIDLEG